MIRLKTLRTAKGLSQKEVSEYLGISQPAYANYERQAREADYETLRKLSILFNVSIDYLLGNYEELDVNDYLVPCSLGFALQILLSIRNMTVNELSDITNIPSYRINDIKHNKCKMSDEEIFAFAKALNVPEFVLQRGIIPDIVFTDKLNSPDKYDFYDKLYSKLDANDKAEIRGEMRQMLKADKYNTEFAQDIFEGLKDDIESSVKREKLHTK